MKKALLIGAVLSTTTYLYSCGGGSGGTGSGTVGFFVTDAHLDRFDQMDVTIYEVRLENPSQNLSCVLFTDANGGYQMNIVTVQNTMRFIDTTSCASGTYTQLVIEMDKSVIVSGFLNQTQYQNIQCSIDPNLNGWEDDTEVVCDNSTCTITVGVEDGGLVIGEGIVNNVAIDFELSDSDGEGDHTIVDITTDGSGNVSSCSVAFEIEEIEPEEMEDHIERTGKSWEVEGVVQNLDANNGSFQVVMEHGMSVSVNYTATTNITGTLTEGAKVEVECSSLDINSAVCTASTIEVK